GLHPGRVDERLGLTADTRSAAEHKLPRLDERAGLVVVFGGTHDRLRLPRQRREVHLDGSVEYTRVGGDAISLDDDEEVSWNERGSVDQLSPAVANHGRLWWQVAAQSLDRPLRLTLLRKREERVQDDHGHDRLPTHRRAPENRQHSGQPEQQRQRVRQLICELTRPPPAAPTQELVATVRDQPPLRLACRQPTRSRLQRLRERLDRPSRVTRSDRGSNN